jgi:DNA excision repair protein ERCC-4
MTSPIKSNPPVINLIEEDEHEDAWNALDEIQGQVGQKLPPSTGAAIAAAERKAWLPDGMDPVLEELPKWSLLAVVLQEIEEELMRQESLGNPPASCKSCLDITYLAAFSSPIMH